jgi:hypothetical protein
MAMPWEDAPFISTLVQPSAPVVPSVPVATRMVAPVTARWAESRTQICAAFCARADGGKRKIKTAMAGRILTHGTAYHWGSFED